MPTSEQIKRRRKTFEIEREMTSCGSSKKVERKCHRKFCVARQQRIVWVGVLLLGQRKIARKRTNSQRNGKYRRQRQTEDIARCTREIIARIVYFCCVSRFFPAWVCDCSIYFLHFRSMFIVQCPLSIVQCGKSVTANSNLQRTVSERSSAQKWRKQREKRHEKLSNCDKIYLTKNLTKCCRTANHFPENLLITIEQHCTSSSISHRSRHSSLAIN